MVASTPTEDVDDEIVLALAQSQSRVLLTEEQDFGLLAYAGGHDTAGVVLIRYPGGARSSLGQVLVDVANDLRIGSVELSITLVRGVTIFHVLLVVVRSVFVGRSKTVTSSISATFAIFVLTAFEARGEIGICAC